MAELGFECRAVWFLTSMSPCHRNYRGRQLLLTEEEKRTLVAEGYPIPTKPPSPKPRRRPWKRVRRKIKNKVKHEADPKPQALGLPGGGAPAPLAVPVLETGEPRKWIHGMVTPGEGQGSLAYCGPRGHGESDTAW